MIGLLGIQNKVLVNFLFCEQKIDIPNQGAVIRVDTNFDFFVQLKEDFDETG